MTKQGQPPPEPTDLGSEHGKDALSVDRLAEALAYRTYYSEAERATIYARLGVTEDEVRSAGHAWGALMGQGLSKADAGLLMRFARTFSRIEQKIRSRRPSPDSVEPSTKQERPALPQARSLPGMRPLEAEAPDGAAAPQGPIDLPSYLLPNATPVEAPEEPVAKKRAELPAHIAAAKGRAVARGTMAVEESALRGPALPFDPNQPVRLPPPAPPPPPTPGVSNLARTEEMSSPPRPQQPASPEVPFRKYVELRVHLERMKDATKAAEMAQLSEAQRVAAEAYWGPRVASDRSVQEAFNTMRKHFEASLD